MRKYYDLQLRRLNDELTEMGALIETAIEYATDALLNKKIEKAQKVKGYEKEIDQKEKDIESLCIKLILHQQPVAKDLRQISAALKMITDMERVGDQAEDLSELAVLLADVPVQMSTQHIAKMAQASAKMVTAGVDAFVKRDVNLAISVCESDDVVDNPFNIVRSDLIDLIRKDAKAGSSALDLLMAAKYYERIGDHAVNIAEWVIFSITGTHRSQSEKNADGLDFSDMLENLPD